VEALDDTVGAEHEELRSSKKISTILRAQWHANDLTMLDLGQHPTARVT
jgi:hypothetical protein